MLGGNSIRRLMVLLLPESKNARLKSQSGVFGFENNAGSDLLSHGVAPTVPSTVSGLTSVFGMGTGVTLIL